MRQINDTVSQFSNGHYCVLFEGDEILLNATTDEEAIAEGKKVLAELQADSGDSEEWA